MGARCGKDAQLYDPAAESAEVPVQSTYSSSSTNSRSTRSAWFAKFDERQPLDVSRVASGTYADQEQRPPSTRSMGREKSVSRDTREHLMTHRISDVQHDYDVGEKAGEGTQGVVFRATRKKTGVMRAIKKVPKNKVSSDNFLKEIDIMKRMDHPNIIRLYETYDDRVCTYLVMELCNGGELFDKIEDQGSLSESQAAIVLQQILRAVQYMHENDICHRDLKPENFIFCTQGDIDEDNPLKLIDFGSACVCDSNTTLKEVVGTPYYVAPQVIAKKYDKMCDLWSCGVIMFTLLTGNVPFHAPSDRQVLDKVREGIARYSERDWGRVSDCGRSLVQKLLTRNPKERIAAQQALDHDWIKLHAPGATAALQDDLVGKLNSFRRKNRLKQAALTIVAAEMSEKQIRTLRETFTALDTNGDGLLTYADIKRGVEKAGLEVSEEVMQPFVAEMDNVIDYTEFVAATLDKRQHLSEEAVRIAFGMFDSEGSGKLTIAEIAKVFEGGGEAKDVLNRYAKKGADAMDFDDFNRMLCHESSPPYRSTPLSDSGEQHGGLEDRFMLLAKGARDFGSFHAQSRAEASPQEEPPDT